MEIKTLGIVGCGKLAEIVVDALINGLLPSYRLIGTMSRTIEKAQYLADKANSANSIQDEHRCQAIDSIDNLLALKPNYIVEAATPNVLKNFALYALESGSSIIPLSIGAFADAKFYEDVQRVALKNGVKVYIPSGSIGGLDVMRTISLMGKTTAKFLAKKTPDSLLKTKVYNEKLKTDEREVFSGNAIEAIEVFPTMVNVAVATSLATVGPSNIHVSMESSPDNVGDLHCITVQNDEAKAEINIYSRTSDIAGWSVVNTLRNIASPIVF